MHIQVLTCCLLATFFLIGCAHVSDTTTYVIPGSPNTLDVAVCAQMDTPEKRIQCYDLVAKYNQNVTVCDYIEPLFSDEYFVQTAQNCVLQLEQSSLYAKGVYNNNTDPAAVFLPQDASVLDDAPQAMLREVTCDGDRLCVSMPYQTDVMIVCLCIH